jgi:hypothetical protein
MIESHVSIADNISRLAWSRYRTCVPLCAACALVRKPWDQPTEEGILASCLQRKLPWTREVDHEAFTAQECALPTTDLSDLESNSLGERHHVAGVDGELLSRAEFDFLNGSARMGLTHSLDKGYLLVSSRNFEIPSALKTG